MNASARVEFRTVDGVTLRGDYYQADGDRQPIVVMTAGLSLLKEHLIPLYANAFQASGVSALAYDYRGWGSSDGLPRQETDLLQQGEDYRDAVTAAMDLPGVDPARVVVFGLGHGGAAAAIGIADDPRPAAAILQSPIVSGRKDSEKWPSGWIERAWLDRERRTRNRDTSATYVPVWPESLPQAQGSGEAVLTNGEAFYRLISAEQPKSEAAGTPWRNEITLQSLLRIARTEARDYLPRIRQPTLYIVPTFSPLTGSADEHRAAFQTMGSNAEFHVFDPPANGTAEQMRAAAIPAHGEFLQRVLHLANTFQGGPVNARTT